MPAPYAGDPSLFEEEVDVIDDSDPPNASNFGSGFEGPLDRTAWLRMTGPKAGQAWRSASPVVDLGGGTAPQLFHANYDAQTGVWLLPSIAKTGGLFASFVQWSYGADDGAPGIGTTAWWTLLGGSATIAPADSVGIIDMATCGDAGTPGLVWAAVLTDNGAELVIKVTSYTSGSWTSKAAITTVASSVRNVEIAPIANRIVVAVGGAFGAAIGVYSGSSSVSFSRIGAVTGTTGMGWSLKSNGSVLVALPTLVTASPKTLWTTTDGVTFTPRDISALLPTGAYAMGVDWSPVARKFFIAVQVSPSSTAFYSSPDGTSWTLVPGTGPNLPIADFAACATGLVLTTTDSPFINANESRLYFSNDWGETWYLAGPAFQANLGTGALGYSRARVVAGPTQLLASNSQYIRFSEPTGFPAAAP